METSPLTSTLRIALVGDYNAATVAHQAIPLAIDDAAAVLELTADYDWLATKDIKSPEDLVGYDAIWVVPGSPYENEDGAFIAIRYARENAIPFLGTCGGFQHAVIEYARNVLGWSDANHGETVQSGRLVITPLSCSLVEQTGEVELRPHTLIARAYGRDEIVEAYHCNFGVASAFVEALNAEALKVTGWDNDGDMRAIELTTHPFFVATLFQHERGALEGRPVPLAREFLRAARR
ncbi:CTP synthase [Cronobacter turicensis]|nr:CTP synthase [Cronobacter turicensis]